MKKKKRFIWLILALIPVIILVSVAMLAKGGIEVKTAPVIKGDLEKYVEERAVVQLEDRVLIHAAAGGRIKEVFKEAGDKVKEGDVLAKLDDQEVLLQIQALEAEKESAEAGYAEALNPADKEEIEMLKAQVKAAETLYNAAKRDADNNKTLYESGAVSFDVYQNSLTRLAEAESNLASAKSNLAIAQKGASSNVRKQFEGQINRIQAQIDLLKKQANDLTVKSPIDGIVFTQEAEVGGFIQPGGLLFEIGRDTGIYLESDILVDEVGDIKLGSPVLIENKDLNVKDLKGRVRKIYPKAFSKISDLGIEQKRVKIEIDLHENIENGSVLKPGYEMDIKVITDSKKNVLLIEESAIFAYQGRDHVFVVENGKAKLRSIEKGMESDKKAEVLQGLREGEVIILSPDETLKEGVKVK
ncbi:MAG: efflux RND transporter periplasmic adaptor subunit [Bacillota bacterium]|nr:HlyD family efflux transporter periplasmic adaptor subunit [Clostridia bacterium]